MRGSAGVLYWAVIGLLALFGLYVSVLAELSLYLLLVPAALFGVQWPGRHFRLEGSFRAGSRRAARNNRYPALRTGSAVE